MSNAPDAVLVVDDDTAIGRVLVALLEQRGLEAKHVPSAEDVVFREMTSAMEPADRG